jgi:hypothetical protein
LRRGSYAVGLAPGASGHRADFARQKVDLAHQGAVSEVQAASAVEDHAEWQIQPRGRADSIEITSPAELAGEQHELRISKSRAVPIGTPGVWGKRRDRKGSAFASGQCHPTNPEDTLHE